MRRQAGFTLIELMIVVGILSILIAIAIPIYLGYTTRAKISEGINLILPLKSGFADYYLVQGRWPENNDEAGAPAPANYSGSHVGSITVGDCGLVTVAFSDPALSTGTLILKPTLDDRGFSWICGSNTIPHNLLPPTCKNSAPVADCTD